MKLSKLLELCGGEIPKKICTECGGRGKSVDILGDEIDCPRCYLSYIHNKAIDSILETDIDITKLLPEDYEIAKILAGSLSKGFGDYTPYDLKQACLILSSLRENMK